MRIFAGDPDWAAGFSPAHASDTKSAQPAQNWPELGTPVCAQSASDQDMRLGQLKDGVLRAAEDVNRNHTLQMAAALSYYFVMSLFPALVLC